MRGNRGFTLVEAAVALLLLGVALVPLLQSVTAGVRSEGDLAARLNAVPLAESRMEELSLLPLDSLGFYLTTRRGTFAPPFARYRWSALLRPAAGSPALVQAAVRVEWEGGAYSLETFFHRPGMLPQVRR
ncbi:MAG TPA: prepilin-type N-terminal cleavage/methylation domain-containing protein [Longimicrobium sp.]|jgi:prepilin-type N-terminal cleavage/methylation domain-containing protein